MSSNTITLTDGQQAAFDEFCQFLLHPTKSVFVLEGFAGTGKTTLTTTLLERLPSLEASVKLINPKFEGWPVQLTATTNKACEAMQQLTSMSVQTIHSFLGLKVVKDLATGESTLQAKDSGDIKNGMLIFIDEASYLDKAMLKWIFALTANCKLVFMGDPAQLTQFDSKGPPPVFTSGYPTARLTEVVRQVEGNPIIALATAFRHTVNTGQWFNFQPDGCNVRVLDRSDWGDAIRQEFTRPDWHHNDSKVLAWTNKTVIRYNHGIREMVKGDPDFKVGDYVVVNQFLPANGKNSFKTDQLAYLSEKSELTEQHGTPGWNIQLDNSVDVFLPRTLADRKAAIKKARKESNYRILRIIDNHWADLRAAYSCTINKAQGSTYDMVFIDLDDIKVCRNPNQIARMLYVAVSRARKRVIFTGDLV